jgi:mono/diheme cytochrome c family protein
VVFVQLSGTVETAVYSLPSTPGTKSSSGHTTIPLAAPAFRADEKCAHAGRGRKYLVKRFLIGFVTGGIALAFCTLGYLRLGLTNVAADAPTSARTTRWMFSSVHASIKRTTPADLKSPQPVTDESLIAGGKLYLNDCVGCHGAPGKPPSDFGATFYPPAPQLARDGTQYSEAQIFWVAKHGIRRTGMSAQGPYYSDQKLWLLAAFISRITNLPPGVRAGIEPKAGP